MILFLSTNDLLGGAAMVTFRLVEACRTHGYYGLAAFKRFGKQG